MGSEEGQWCGNQGRTTMTQGSNKLHFFYDAQAVPDNYMKNLQGNIVAILDNTGTTVGNYVYEAWGRPISRPPSMKEVLGELNSFRYNV